ncbi:Flagellar L-ring protein FlgH [hydrothermal vent metagenome]|uniref:Flagellar L-ring protein FlgH n=1 Tax=hydrothermal vent metagenome TaxID=652676 RepID=A0A3B0ZVE0_9ZZZZ
MKKLIKTAFVLLVVSTVSACSLVKKEKEENSFKPTPPVVIKLPKEDNGAIFRPEMNVGLFDDNNARNIGDLLTIVLNENTNASSSANTSATKDQKVDLPSPKLAGDTVTKDGKEILNNEVEAGREFNGQGTSAQNSSFSGTISVTVAKVLPNRNLIIRGEKLVRLNQTEEFIRFSGIVRPQDIKPNNTVESNRVANVHVMYAGNGAISAANSMGALGRFFQGKSWPY